MKTASLSAYGLLSVFAVVAMVSLSSCSGKSSGKYQDTYSSGTINIAVDESLMPLMEAEIAVFCSTYGNAKINVQYIGEGQAVEQLLTDSARLIVIPRLLNEQESKALLDGQKISPKFVRIGYDGMVIIANPKNKLKILQLDQLKSLLDGSVQTWSQFNGKRSGKDTIQVVVDDPNSSTVRYLVDSVFAGKPVPKNLYAAGNSEAVIKYVKENPDALGIIGLAWVSDRDDSTANKFRSDVNIIEVARDTTKPWEYSYLPYTYNLYKREYPLIRSIYVIHSDAHFGLARGFEVFLAGDVGQRIIHKMDMLSQSSFIRLVDTSKRENY